MFLSKVRRPPPGLRRIYPVVARSFLSAISGIVFIAVSAFALSQSAHALPSFARQTGQPCGTCHTDFPFLTPYGRLFKLNGYTVGGGQFRTTPFPVFPD